MQTATSVRNDEFPIVLDTSHLIIEDDTPVDNIFTEKQERLLTAPLYASWEGPPSEEGQPPRSFEVFANVGLFHSIHEQAIVPDVMLSLDVKIKPDLSKRENRTYFVWEFGKAPEVVIEVVSNRVGGELTDKLHRYRKMHIPYYVVYDPDHELSSTALRTYELRGDLYIQLKTNFFESIGLGLVEWEGVHEHYQATWLRWCTKDGKVLPSPEELASDALKRAETSDKRAEASDKRAEASDKRAEASDKRAEQLAARLRALGIDPDTV